MLGLVIFKESLSFVQIALMALVFVGVALMAMRDYPPHLLRRFEKGVWLALITALGLGLLDFFTASAARSYSPILAIWLPWTTFTIACFILLARRGALRSMPSHFARYAPLIIPMVLFDGAAWVTYAYALERGSLAIVTAITESYPALALILGVWLNREFIKKHQWTGAGLALLGSISLAVIY